MRFPHVQQEEFLPAIHYAFQLLHRDFGTAAEGFVIDGFLIVG